MNRGYLTFAVEEEKVLKTEALNKFELDSIHGAKSGLDAEYYFEDYLIDATHPGDTVFINSIEELGNTMEQKISSLEYVRDNDIKVHLITGTENALLYGFDYKAVEVAGNLFALLMAKGKIE